MAASQSLNRLELDYFVVDVFTETPLAGNPLAVVMNTCGLATDKMQAIAREFNLSETTFVERRAAEVERAEGVRVRIFTTQEELPFAGHPTLGTASVLKLEAPETLRVDTVTLHESVGPVPVRFEGRESVWRNDAAGPGVWRGAGSRGGGAAAGAQRAGSGAGTFAADCVDGKSVCDCSVRSLEALGRLKVGQDEATRWLRDRGGRWFYVMAPNDGQNGDGAKYRARMQFYGGEDPATGSAAGCAIGYLVERGVVAPGERIHVRQGVEMGRPSDLFLSAKMESARVRNVRVAGSTVLVAKGRFFLP